MADSIEAAYRTLLAEAENAIAGLPIGLIYKDAARALALAVLDRAQTTWRSDPEKYMQLQDALRARIEALGK